MTFSPLLTLLACIAALDFASPIFIPLIVAFFFFLLLDPVVDWAVKHGSSRVIGSLGAVCSSVLIIVLISWGLYGAFVNIAKEIPQYSSKIRSVISKVEQKAEIIQKNTATIVPQNKNMPDDVQKVEVVQNYGPATSFALKGINTAFDAVTNAIFIPLLAFFFLTEKTHLQSALKKITPPTFDTQKVETDAVKMVRGYFVGNLVIGCGMSVMLSILFLSFGLKNAIPLGLVAGFLNLIPFLGPLISLVLPLTAGLMQFNSLTPFVVIAGSVFILHFGVANILVPKFIGSQIDTNPLAGTLGLLFWGWLWGAIGLLFAVPLIAFLKIILQNYEPLKAWSQILSNGPLPEKKSLIKKLLMRRIAKSGAV